MYLIGFALFTLASALCGFASDLAQLIAFRALLGMAGAMLGANSIVILVRAAGPSRQGRAMGIFAAAQAQSASAWDPLSAVCCWQHSAGVGCSGLLSRSHWPERSSAGWSFRKRPLSGLTDGSTGKGRYC